MGRNFFAAKLKIEVARWNWLQNVDSSESVNKIVIFQLFSFQKLVKRKKCFQDYYLLFVFVIVLLKPLLIRL